MKEVINVEDEEGGDDKMSFVAQAAEVLSSKAGRAGDSQETTF